MKLHWKSTENYLEICKSWQVINTFKNSVWDKGKQMILGNTENVAYQKWEEVKNVWFNIYSQNTG